MPLVQAVSWPTVVLKTSAGGLAWLVGLVAGSQANGPSMTVWDGCGVPELQTHGESSAPLQAPPSTSQARVPIDQTRSSHCSVPAALKPETDAVMGTATG